MTSKNNCHFELSGAYRLLAALFAVAALTGCHVEFIGPSLAAFVPATQPTAIAIRD